ncbi:hypothetical protein [Dactylosporangium sp. CA-139066]|uniref:hypothetical protein n=1 Tax=Dactylosporangium sp. CA-139066 TaxID=3239930 RepID=UPI003D90C312
MVIVTPGTEADPYGGMRSSWTTATRTTVRGWLQESVAPEAPDDSRTDDASGWTLILPGNPPIDERCRVEANGETFRIVFRPRVVNSPRGVHHVEVKVMPLGPT